MQSCPNALVCQYWYSNNTPLLSFIYAVSMRCILAIPQSIWHPWQWPTHHDDPAFTVFHPSSYHLCPKKHQFHHKKHPQSTDNIAPEHSENILFTFYYFRVGFGWFCFILWWFNCGKIDVCFCLLEKKIDEERAKTFFRQLFCTHNWHVEENKKEVL